MTVAPFHVAAVPVRNGHDPILDELLDNILDELLEQGAADVAVARVLERLIPVLSSFDQRMRNLDELTAALRALESTVAGSTLERMAKLPKHLEGVLDRMDRWFSPGKEMVPINVPINAATAQLVSAAGPRVSLQFTIPAPAQGATQYDAFFGFSKEVQNVPDTGFGPMGTRLTAGGTQVMGPELDDSVEVWMIMAPNAPVTTVTGYALLRKR